MDLFTILIFLGVAAVTLGLKLGRERRRRDTRSSTPTIELAADTKDEPSAPSIAALPTFDWKTAEPLKFRPMKPIYHITMALQNSAPADLITIDCYYESRVLQRRALMAKNPETVMGAIPEGVSAVQELYSYLLTEYLPFRYPDMFSLSDDGKVFTNHVTHTSWPCLPPEDPLEAWKILGETIEDDLFLLRETNEGHQAVAFLCCFPAGFDPSSKLGKLLKDIHGPVPSYDKIGPSMERFFSRLEVGKSVRRNNWSVQTKTDLYSPSGNHVHDGDKVEENAEVDIETARLRIELQTLTRLPKTGSILFSFKTYMYPVTEVKKEGLGPLFADAIEGLKSGNAPGMWTYKGAVRWGQSICEYLRA